MSRAYQSSNYFGLDPIFSPCIYICPRKDFYANYSRRKREEGRRKKQVSQKLDLKGRGKREEGRRK
ncbi:hypothetical protein [Okeania sp. SIO1I7]|uniref:hypothetical protein n=1 Tax=Okeania sp. SIO1I7 TaxID=2607772 RepID=UPI0013FC4408|nr:hypothetical protein [Okeania sp. SIO1I7]NET24162.1 hypothetical protein [Okeania sp. SIO1I7]